MKFEYNNTCTLIDSSKHVHVVQKLNPFTMTEINSLEDAQVWTRQYLMNQFNAQAIFFKLEVYKNDELIEESLTTHEDYKIKLKETTGRLVGKYSMNIQNEDVSFELLFNFMDGEAESIVDFNNTGVYELDLSCEFFIGEDKFLPLINISDEENNMMISVV